MDVSEKNISFSYTKFPTGTFSVGISQDLVRPIYNFILQDQQLSFHTRGFQSGIVAPGYIEKTCRHTIVSHLKELFFNHCVLGFVCRQMHLNRITMIGEPELADVYIDPENSARFDFNYAPVDPTLPRQWKKLIYRTPSRKGYKDLDKQALSFFEEENKTMPNQIDQKISPGDWVRFSISLIIDKKNRCELSHSDILWIKIGTETINKDIAAIFLNRKRSDSIISSHDFFQNYVSNKLNAEYEFIIRILDIVPYEYFSFDLFKKQFFLSTSQDVHSKFIEVLSTRNDITQRHEIVTSVLNLLINKSIIMIPQKCIDLEKENVVQSLRENPDYLVFRLQSNFKNLVTSLAERQLKEHIILDALAHAEGLSSTDQDVRAYLNLMQRPKTKEFIYSLMPSSKIYDQEIPLPEDYLKRFCLREKTLNYVIHQLTRA
ncbi:MAG: hypothetical protein UU47_C0001G0021 [candidate division TM6 bacterium GW2011_GWE2_41_16]|nr:MAG: hypothetical protein UU47_C0001G0021 [candidate division TM6 bacterium GW2011_GWE2_41_16]